MAVIVLSIHLLPDYAELEDRCSEHPLICGIVTSTLATALVAGFIGLIWLGGLSRFLVMRAYRRSILQGTHPGLETAAGLPLRNLAPRSPTLEELNTELSRGSLNNVVFVLGDSGIGKTSLLLMLAQQLAERGLLPIFATLHAEDLPFAVSLIARDRFEQTFEPFAGSRELLDRVWTAGRSQARFVLLVDGLDEVGRHLPSRQRTDLVKFSLRGLALLRVPTVLASRPDTIPPGTPGTIVRLGPLSHTAAMTALSALTPPGAEQWMPELVRRGGLQESPLLLRLAGPVLSSRPHQLLDPELSQEAIRLGIVDAYFNLLGRQQFSHGRGLASILGDAALALLRTQSYDRPMGDILSKLGDGVDTDLLLEALERGEGLGVIVRRIVGGQLWVSFRHPLLLAYCGSAALSDSITSLPDLHGAVREVLRTSVLPEASTTVEMLALRRPDLRERREVIDGLIESGSGGQRAGDPLNALNAAARLLTPSRTVSSRPRLLDALTRSWDEASLASQHTALDLVAGWDEPEAVEFLMGLEDDPSYSIRWMAAGALARSGRAGWDVLRQRTDNYLAVVDAALANVVPASELQERVNWYLPSLVDGLTAKPESWKEGRRRLVDLVRAAQRLSENDIPGCLGVESSLAQGFKLAAMERPDLPVDPLVVFVANHARFWYARLEALQAVAMRTPTTRRGKVLPFISRIAISDLHPFVRAMAASCLQGSAEGLYIRHTWSDESTAMRRHETTLSDSALLLLAEVALFLNMNEHAQGDQRRRNASRHDLPSCLRSGRERRRLVEGTCADDCGFGLCPYRPPAEAGRFGAWRGGFGPSFCRSVRYAAHRAGTPPWFDGSARQFVAFWHVEEGRTVET